MEELVLDWRMETVIQRDVWSSTRGYESERH